MSNSGDKARKVNLRDTSTSELFQYKKVGQLNDHMLNIVCGQNRTLDFHVHEDSDEIFYIIEGDMQLEFEDRIVNLSEGDFFIVPKGVSHRPVCTSPVKVLLIEKDGTLSKSNTGGSY